MGYYRIESFVIADSIKLGDMSSVSRELTNQFSFEFTLANTARQKTGFIRKKNAHAQV